MQGFDASVGGKPPKGTAIQAGDLILSVNGKKVSTLKVEEVAASLLSGFDAVELELGRRYIGYGRNIDDVIIVSTVATVQFGIVNECCWHVDRDCARTTKLQSPTKTWDVG